MENYYEALEVTPTFKKLKLGRQYFKHLILAIRTNDTEKIIKTTKAFEVLRNEAVHLEYFRLYRKYILEEELNYPEVREEGMQRIINSREQTGIQKAESLIKSKTSVYRLYLNHLIDYILFDLSYVQFSSLFFIVIWAVLINGSDSVSLNIFISLAMLILITLIIRTRIIRLIEQ